MEEAFGPWKGPGAPGRGAAALAPGGPRRLLVVDRPGSVQSEIRVGRPAVKVTDPDYYPLLVANTIFGGAFGSRLVQNIREDKGYTYSPGGSVRPWSREECCTSRAAVRNEVTAATLLEIVYEMDRMATTPPDRRRAGARQALPGRPLPAAQPDPGRGRLHPGVELGQGAAARGPGRLRPQGRRGHRRRRSAGWGRSYFPSRTQTVVVGGDEAKIRSEVAPFGKVEEIQP